MEYPSAEIRVIGLDLDGTAFNDQKQLTPRTLAAIRAAAQRGVAVLPATGRVLAGLPQAFLQIPGVRYALTSNGAAVVQLDTGALLVEHTLPQRHALALLDLLEGPDTVVSLYQGGKAYVSEAGYRRIPQLIRPSIQRYMLDTFQPLPSLQAFVQAHPAHIEKLSATFASQERRSALWQAAAKAVPCAIAASFDNNMEVSAPDATKGNALVDLARALGYQAANVMACGDSGNDLTMIRAAGLGVAMANATPEILQAADYITASNNEDGVALAIERFVLKG